MSERAYVQVGYPWAAAFEASQPAPVSYLASLIRQTLRYGMPARRYGPLGAWLVRNTVSMPLLRFGLRAHRRRARPEIDDLLAQVEASWTALAAASLRLPEALPGRLSALVLKRRSADTTFVFGNGPAPLIVCKTPRGEDTSLELEATALDEAAAAEVGPRHLGRVGDAFVQEALPGAPLEVETITPDNAAGLSWSNEHAALSDALIRLAETTVRPGPPQELRPELHDALERAEMNESARATARSALDDLGRFEIAVLRHGDTSAQNCLFDNGRFSGLVDWEIARPQGAPAFDILNAAVALIDHGVGAVRWSEERAVRCFELAWKNSPFFEGARDGARKATLAAGGTDADYERLEVAFFARRLASRAASPSDYATGPESAARMLEIACAR